MIILIQLQLSLLLHYSCVSATQCHVYIRVVQKTQKVNNQYTSMLLPFIMFHVCHMTSHVGISKGFEKICQTIQFQLTWRIRGQQLKSYPMALQYSRMREIRIGFLDQSEKSSILFDIPTKWCSRQYSTVDQLVE